MYLTTTAAAAAVVKSSGGISRDKSRAIVGRPLLSPETRWPQRFFGGGGDKSANTSGPGGRLCVNLNAAKPTYRVRPFCCPCRFTEFCSGLAAPAIPDRSWNFDSILRLGVVDIGLMLLWPHCGYDRTVNNTAVGQKRRAISLRSRVTRRPPKTPITRPKDPHSSVSKTRSQAEENVVQKSMIYGIADDCQFDDYQPDGLILFVRRFLHAGQREITDVVNRIAGGI